MEEALAKHAKKTFIIGMIIWTAIAMMTNIDENITAFILRSLGPQTNSMIGSMAKMAAFFSGYIAILFVLAGSWYGYLVLKEKNRTQDVL